MRPMTPFAIKRNVGFLAACQALFQSATILGLTLSGLVGFALAPTPALATLPVTAVVLGTALATIPASFVMKRIGRRRGFLIGVGCGIASAAISSTAIVMGNFWLFAAGHLLAGIYQAFAQYYRFAAADMAGPAFRAKAVSWVLVGGLVAAFMGPALVRLTKDIVAVEFLGAYLGLIALGLLAIVLLLIVDLPEPSVAEQTESGRPLRAVMAQPTFIVAVLVAAIGYGVMVLAMTATPLAMVTHHHHSVDDASLVIQWHVVGMFAPSFFTGWLITRYGVVTIMLAGVAILFGHVAIAVSGIELLHYYSALILLGIGWNFTFIGGTTLVTETYGPAERAKTQAANEFIIFGTVAMASFSSGALLHLFGWTWVNIGALPFLALAGGALLWLMPRRRAALAIKP